MTIAAVHGELPERSVFAGADIAATAGLNWKSGAVRPRFEDEVWSLKGWADAPVQMKSPEGNWNFGRIHHPAWRVVAKELCLSWLASKDERVLALPRARRIPRHPRTVWSRLYLLSFWFNWLHERRITTLAAVTQDHCDAFVQEYNVVRDETGEVIRPKSANSLRSLVSGMQEISDYADVLSADRYRTGFRPWGERSPREITGTPSRPDIQIKTQPLPDEVLSPLLGASLLLVEVLGPHIAGLRRTLQADRDQWNTAKRSRYLRMNEQDELAAIIDSYLRAERPLPQLEPGHVNRRLHRGWDPHDPLLHVSFQHLARPTGHWDFSPQMFKRSRPMLETAVDEVGHEFIWCRDGAEVPRADTGELVPWSLPLPASQADALIRIAVHACVITTSALTGMRSSELMELAVGCRVTAEEDAPGLARHRLASKVVKGRRWGGEPDEWVVIDEVIRAIALAEALTDAAEGELLFGRFQNFDNGAVRWLRKWVASPAGRRLGLAPIPEDQIHPRRLRRTLSVEMAARPGGLFATKVHFKHLSVVTSEGYAHRPGGAQAVFHHEWKRAETAEKLTRTVEAFRQFQDGQLPAGPGADALLSTFRAVEDELEDHEPGPAKVVTDRQIELLLKKKAAVLHLGAANYCWFEDPAKALCLKLAGAKSAAAPLTGMCDSARCPQATHHLVHRSVWQTAADNGTVLLASPRIPAGEKARLRAEHERSMRILEEIDKAAGKAG
ncbi:hypothetical protein ACFWCA_32180 [Streptomyces phaeochromogenes]|uniref:hypothetical protein n=1 Tax=Streptomyces phaeochromogenes TaxID=1923 RepID=UPI00368FFF1D